MERDKQFYDVCHKVVIFYFREAKCKKINYDNKK